MKDFLAILCVIVCTADATPTGRIFGGQTATAGQFPFMVAINDLNQFCSGVIIAPSWILTVGGCIFFRPPAEIYVGSPINLINGTAYTVFERIGHGEFDYYSLQNDIALIRINSVLEFGENVQPVEMGTDPAPNSTCTAIGWGATESNSYPPLQYLETMAIDMALCQSVSADTIGWRYLGPGQICTLNDPGQGACKGDDGGALICDGKLSGIYSYTVNFQCASGLPDVYSSIATYTDWIRSYVTL